MGRAARWLLFAGSLGVGLPWQGAALHAQTLARPGWVGSGLTVERWWRNAVIVDVPASEGAGADAEWKGTIDRLDAMRTVGVDGLLLRGVGGEVASPTAAEPGSGVGGVDDLLREASRRGLRVLMELRGDQPAAELGGAARSWTARGAAGFLVVGGGAEALRTVRAAMRGVPGERVLVSDGTAAPGGAELTMEVVSGLSPRPDAARLRVALGQIRNTGSVLLTDREPGGAGSAPELARVAAAAVLLGGPGAALIEEDWLGAAGGAGTAGSSGTSGSAGAAGAHSLGEQLQQFSGLHHDRPAFRDGATTVLDDGGQGAVVWLRRDPGGAVTVVAANLGPTPVKLSLVDDVARLHLRGTFLKTVSRSDYGLGGMPLSAVALPGFGVYVGELSR